MRRSVQVGWCLLTGAVLLALLLWRQDRRLDESIRAETAALERKRASLETASQSNAGEPSPIVAKLEPVPNPAPKPKDSAPAQGYKPAYQVLRQDAKIQAAYFAAKRAGITTAYGPLFRKLQLSTEQTEALKTLILRREEDVFDTAAAVPRTFRAMTEFDDSETARLTINPYDAISYSAGRLPPASMPTNDDTAAVVTLMTQNVEAFRTAATALLGADGFGQLQEYERILPMQPAVNELAGVLGDSAQPLTVSQADALSQLLAESSLGYQQGGDATPGSIDWEQAAERLQSVLTAQQIQSVQYSVDFWRTVRRYEAALSQLSSPR